MSPSDISAIFDLYKKIIKPIIYTSIFVLIYLYLLENSERFVLRFNFGVFAFERHLNAFR